MSAMGVQSMVNRPATRILTPSPTATSNNNRDKLDVRDEGAVTGGTDLPTAVAAGSRPWMGERERPDRVNRGERDEAIRHAQQTAGGPRQAHGGAYSHLETRC